MHLLRWMEKESQSASESLCTRNTETPTWNCTESRIRHFMRPSGVDGTDIPFAVNLEEIYRGNVKKGLHTGKRSAMI